MSTQPLDNPVAALSERTQGMFEHWLACLIYKGMFSDELGVKYKTASFFVPRDQVKHLEGKEGRVRVRTFTQGKDWFAVLPTEDQVIIPVTKSDLVPV